MKIFILISISLLSFFTKSQEFSYTQSSLSAGLIDQHIGRFQEDTSGDTNSMDYRVFLKGDIVFTFWEEWNLIPEIGFIWPGNEDDSDTYSEKSYFVNILGGYEVNEYIRTKLGGGLFMSELEGKGGITYLPNGTNSSEAFYTPNGKSTTRNLTTILGATFWPKSMISADIEVFIFNINSSQDRSVTYTLAATFNFGDFI